MADFGGRLRFWRRKLKFSQNLLAQKSGVSPVTIGQIETGKRKARKQTMQKLMDGLGISEVQFLGVTQEIAQEIDTSPSQVEAPAIAESVFNKPRDENVPVILSNLDLEIINRVLNLSFDGKINVLKYLKVLS